MFRLNGIEVRMDNDFIALSKGKLLGGTAAGESSTTTLAIYGGNSPYINLDSSGQSTSIHADRITTPTLSQTSLESKKKNFEKLGDVLKIVKNSEIYQYNFRTEQNTDKKHIGFVIPDEKGNFKTPTEVILGDGIDIYSMVSILWRAVQEQQEKIEKFEETIANNVKK